MNQLQHWFAHPRAFGLLAILPVLWVLGFVAARRRRRALIGLGTLPALETLIARRSLLRLFRNLCWSCGVFALVFGIAGPQWGREWGQSATPGRDLVLVLDMSRSMFAQDTLPNRVTRARDAIVDLVDNGLRQRGGHRVALIVFASRPRVICSLTHDYDHFLEAVGRLRTDRPAADLDIWPKEEGESGTRIGAALALALSANEIGGGPGSYRDILLLSDGDDPAADAARERTEGVNQAMKERARVHTIGFGDPDDESELPFTYAEKVSTRLREGPLRDMARLSGGTYTPARKNDLPLATVYRECIEPLPVQESEEDTLPGYEQRYTWFLGAALAFLFLDTIVGMGLGRTRDRGWSGPAIVVR